MINAFHLSDAAPAAMFGMFAIWGAASKWHWFIRTAVVAAALLATLFIPAFEVAIQLGLECLLVVVGLQLWRQRRERHAKANAIPETAAPRFRLSMQTLMLAVVVVAVIAAVAGQAPSIPMVTMYRLMINGVAAAATCLTAIWLVFGRARWWLRLIAAPLLVVVIAAATQFLIVNQLLFDNWGRISTFADYTALVTRYNWPGVSYWVLITSLGLPALVVWLLFMRAAGWLDPFDENERDGKQDTLTNRPRRFARSAVIAWFTLVAAFLFALFYRLVTPRPIPQVDLPNPNGFDDFVAAGNMIGPTYASQFDNWDKLSTAQLTRAVEENTDAFERSRLGLERPCLNPYGFLPPPAGTDRAIIYLFSGQRGRINLAVVSKDRQQQLEIALESLQISHALCRGLADLDWSILYEYEFCFQTVIWHCLRFESATECMARARELVELDHQRDPWPVVAERIRTHEENAGWQRRAQSILSEWSDDRYLSGEKQEYLRSMTRLRMLCIMLALRAYEMEHQRELPESLADLVPKYLSTLPLDPFSDHPFHYRKEPDGQVHLEPDGYLLYSVGPDGHDDAGQPSPLNGDWQRGDLPETQMFPARSSP